jgi:GGDEF domain-containing protein
MLYNVNLDRFKQIRDTYEDKESDYYKKVVAEIPILESRIAEVESILQNSYSQISDADLAIAQAEINAEELAKVSG